MKFSQRIGKKPISKSIQLESIDEELKNGLWNVIHIHIIRRCSKGVSYDASYNFYILCTLLFQKLYKFPVDTIPKDDAAREKFLKTEFFNSEWYEVYDTIEFMASLTYDFINRKAFVDAINSELELEFSGYRLINGLIAPISNKVEMQEISQSLLQSEYFTSLNGANIHLSNALDKLSDKKNPDYRNSIKESISAVETTCRILTGEATLGKALNSLEKKGLKIDERLKNGFDKIYAYTNSQGGIRHAIVDNQTTPDFDDAKYMLVTCSAFINYLVGKCKSLNVPIQ